MSLRGSLATAAVVFLAAGTAQAQVSRVFVSVNGNDANVCSNIATPCRTLGGGIGQVDPHGEVIVIDSGSFAGGTISKSVKIDVAAGAVAFSGLPITVDPGAGGIVVLRGLTLKAASVGTGTGVTHESGTLFVENSVLDGWQQGLFVNSGAQRLSVKGSVFRNQFPGVGLGVGGSSSTSVVVHESSFENNVHGISVVIGKLRVSNSTFSHNVSAGVLASTALANVAVQRCEFTGNTFGVYVQTTATARVSHSTITHNSDTGLANAGGTLYSYGNNLVAENTTNIGGVLTTAALQ